jgi:hypothetical protein
MRLILLLIGLTAFVLGDVWMAVGVFVALAVLVRYFPPGPPPSSGHVGGVRWRS